MRLLAWSQALSASALAVIVLFRQAGSPSEYLAVLFRVQKTSTLVAVANTFNVALVGIVIFSAIETGYAALSLAVWLFNVLLRAFLPTSIAPRPFDVRGWPRLMRHPQRSTSLHEFWGKRWHGLFKRIFVHDGSKTLSRTAQAVGGEKQLATASGAIGAFVVSGWMHESCKCSQKTSFGKRLK